MAEGAGGFSHATVRQNALKSGFVKGHDFSHADKVNRTTGLQPLAFFRLLQFNFVSHLGHAFTHATA
jgi:hypothetical protein